MRGESTLSKFLEKTYNRLFPLYLSRVDNCCLPQASYNFPGTTCISVDEEAAHGIPGGKVLVASDLVNIDVSAEISGYFGDTGGSFINPPESNLKKNLCMVTKGALELAIDEARDGRPFNVIGREIETQARRSNLTVIRNLGSHGVGRALHEGPGFIPGYCDRNDTRILKLNQVITIEPLLSTGAREVLDSGDGWTLITNSDYIL